MHGSSAQPAHLCSHKASAWCASHAAACLPTPTLTLPHVWACLAVLAAAVQACRVWLKRLFQAHNVTSVTSTGHSLGGGLATISAFGVADLLDTCWDDWAQERQDQKWQTQVSRTGSATHAAWATAWAGAPCVKKPHVLSM